MIGIGTKLSAYSPIIAIIGFFLLLFLGQQLYDVRRENKSLRKVVERFEKDLELEKEEIQAKMDSLQMIIKKQGEENCILQEEILELENLKSKVNSDANKRKDGILRIRDVDNLRYEIARHYRH